MSNISDERLAELIKLHDVGWPIDGQSHTAAALRELQQWRSGIEPSTGMPIGRLVVMEPWTDEAE